MALARKPIAVVDIGSNSVRLVVYSGRQRAPSPIFNEKVMAGLGAGLRDDGEMSLDSEQKALSALSRYKLLLKHMGVKEAQVVATAAVRDAANADDFVQAVNDIALHHAPHAVGTVGVLKPYPG